MTAGSLLLNLLMIFIDGWLVYVIVYVTLTLTVYVIVIAITIAIVYVWLYRCMIGAF